MTKPIKRHPDGATLMSYAAGILPEALSAVVATHANLCPECRGRIADLEMLGGALLMAEPKADGAASLPARPGRALRSAAVGPAPTIAPSERLPAPIVRAYGLSFDAIPWKRLAPGVWHHRLPLSAGAEGDLRLLRIAAGRGMPDHGHSGSELTLVIDGAFHDSTGEYGRGDVQDLDEETEHTPIADPEVGCVCLIATESPARFKGLVARLMQPFTGM